MDLNSLNGTWLNGHRLASQSPMFLRDTDHIVLANSPDFVIEVVISGGNMTERFSPPKEARTEKKQGLLTGIYYDALYKQFIVDGHRVDPSFFSKTEHKTLQFLAIQPGRVRTYDDLAAHVWDDWVQNNTIAKTIGNIRHKLDEISPGAGDYIQTIRGRGFRCRIG